MGISTGVLTIFFLLTRLRLSTWAVQPSVCGTSIPGFDLSSTINCLYGVSRSRLSRVCFQTMLYMCNFIQLPNMCFVEPLTRTTIPFPLSRPKPDIMVDNRTVIDGTQKHRQSLEDRLDNEK